MKDFIKKRLAEAMGNTNALGVQVSRPDQILIIMRGISGSGKSTRAKSVVGGGVIHSTDTLIDNITGDYNKFFADMKASGSGDRLTKMHKLNLVKAKTSMDGGSSPVVIDNTNLSPSDAKPYVVAALQMGYADENIRIEDVGTGGLSVEELAARNTHGVPLDRINAMVQRYNAAGPLTLEKILGAKDHSQASNILYTAVVLDDDSHKTLLRTFEKDIPEGWGTFAHHMTITFMKPLPTPADLGKRVELHATHIGLSDMAMAVRVAGYPSTNEIPHITVAVNPAGGKPVMSNKITDWEPIQKLSLTGTVTEFKKS